MKSLSDWTKSDDADLKYFSGTATYKAAVKLGSAPAGGASVSIGRLSTGVAHVFVNGADCGTVWCHPWEAEIPAHVLNSHENEIEIRYTNNWYNRLVGDCFLNPEGRVTRSTLHYWNVPRVKNDPARPWRPTPTFCSGPSSSDALQSSGLLGPVVLRGL